MARDEGKVWLVSYALPGEVVEAEPRGRQGGVAVAATTRVLEPSPHRVAAPCPYFGACGGCQLQHATYTHQLDLKRQVVAEAWARAGLRLPPDAAVLGMEDPWRYRIRGEFEAVAEASGWRFGFHRMRSHAVLPVDSCAIHDERIERALPAFARAANELRLTGLQNLLLTVEPAGRGLLWRLRENSKGWLHDEYAHRVAELLPDAALLDDAMSLDFWDMTFRVRSDTFVQTNYRQMLVLYRAALDMLQPMPEERVLDLRRHRHHLGRSRTRLPLGHRGRGEPARGPAWAPERPHQLGPRRVPAGQSRRRAARSPARAARRGDPRSATRRLRTRRDRRARPVGGRARRLRQLRALNPGPGHRRPGARRLQGQARGDRGHVSADLPHRIRGPARTKLAG